MSSETWIINKEAKRRTNFRATNWKFRSDVMEAIDKDCEKRIYSDTRYKHCAPMKIQLHCLMTMQRGKRADVAYC